MKITDLEQVTNINIPKDVKNIVIFVHGFGVRWDSRGMFTDIKLSLPADWGSVLFDFYKVDGKDVYIQSIKDQISRLSSVLEGILKDNPAATIHLIAHSKGCIITSLAIPDVGGKVIFLAPPENFGTKMEDYFRRYPGSKSDDHEIIIPRKDGTITHIPVEFFVEAAQIQAELEMNKYASNREINLVQTTEDEVIGQTSYELLQTNSNVSIHRLVSDHNFTGEYRNKLIESIKNILNT